MADNVPHGIQRYRWFNCRCLVCAKAYRRSERYKAEEAARKDVMPHGTAHRYAAGCRCKKCMSTAEIAIAAGLVTRKSAWGLRNVIQAGDGDKRHGTWNGYNNHGCRCAECQAAAKARNLAARLKRQ